jgi:hypothetical protein
VAFDRTLTRIAPSDLLPVGRPLAPICESRAGYIGETALTDARGASVSRTSAADMRHRMVGHDIATEHAGAPNLRQ